MQRFLSSISDFWDTSGRARFVSGSLILTCCFALVVVGIYFAFVFLLEAIGVAK